MKRWRMPSVFALERGGRQRNRSEWPVVVYFRDLETGIYEVDVPEGTLKVAGTFLSATEFPRFAFWLDDRPYFPCFVLLKDRVVIDPPVTAPAKHGWTVGAVLWLLFCIAWILFFGFLFFYTLPSAIGPVF